MIEAGTFMIGFFVGAMLSMLVTLASCGPLMEGQGLMLGRDVERCITVAKDTEGARTALYECHVNRECLRVVQLQNCPDLPRLGEGHD